MERKWYKNGESKKIKVNSKEDISYVCITDGHTKRICILESRTEKVGLVLCMKSKREERKSKINKFNGIWGEERG